MRKKFYIKKYEEVAGFKVWIVDGDYIRKNVDIEFTNFGQHYRFSFIPKNEFWIDKEYSHNEKKFYITNMLVTSRLISDGKNYEEAVARADAIEHKERSKSKLIQSKIKMIPKKKLIQNVHKRLLIKYSKNIKVWIVNGELVRDLFFLDFTEGGHDKVYPFVPLNEIWLDDDNTTKERKFILLHEVHERNLMNKGWNYEKAHKSASEIEYSCRRNPKILEKNLINELEKVN
jgi:hypothetical protein